VDLVHVPVARVHVLAVPVVPVAPVVRAGLVVRERVVLVVPVAPVHVRVVPVVRRWVARVPVALVVRVPVVPVARALAVPVVRVGPVATDRTASAVRPARSRARVVVATWKSCNRS
jgi:hypothetical protein